MSLPDTFKTDASVFSQKDGKLPVPVTAGTLANDGGSPEAPAAKSDHGPNA